MVRLIKHACLLMLAPAGAEEDPLDLWNKADRLARQGKFEHAALLLDKLVSPIYDGPAGDFDVLVRRGNVLARVLGRDQDSESSLRRALAMRPADRSVRFMLAQALSHMPGRFGDAAQEYEQLIRGGEAEGNLPLEHVHYEYALYMTLLGPKHGESTAMAHFASARRIFSARYNRARASYLSSSVTSCPEYASMQHHQKVRFEILETNTDVYKISGAAYHEGNVRLWYASSSYIVGPDAVVIDENLCLIDAVLPLELPLHKNLPADLSAIVSTSTRLTRAILAVGLFSSKTFADFVMQSLPRLVLLLPSLSLGNPSLIVPSDSTGNIKQYVYDIIALLNIKKSLHAYTVKSAAGPHLAVDRLSIITWDDIQVSDVDLVQAGSTRTVCSHCPPRVAYQRFRDIVGIPPLKVARQTRSLLYWASRSSGSVYRVLKNQKAFLRVLQKELKNKLGKSAQLALFKGESPREAIPMLAKASVLAGVHGSALANALFLPENAAVVELAFPQRYLQRLFSQLAASCNVSFWPIPIDDPSATHQGSFLSILDPLGVAKQIAHVAEAVDIGISAVHKMKAETVDDERGEL
eukprot:TRINITY_DN29942_c0_g1_i1.p1 TRINITY_DN29942_c0_g1~~TRINITY_DN29942_c0_g1_i1.p1  ORF type:complete len:580 (+),score=50.86 TRINITY_DN29942_c0_g1_i1:65-1804(+)